MTDGALAGELDLRGRVTRTLPRYAVTVTSDIADVAGAWADLAAKGEPDSPAQTYAFTRLWADRLGVPERDRYQIVTEHSRAQMVIEDTGLGLERTDKLVVVQVTTRKRKKKQKEAF